MTLGFGALDLAGFIVQYNVLVRGCRVSWIPEGWTKAQPRP